jgi:hypothetical protein
MRELRTRSKLSWPVSSTRFIRDVLASVVATGVATVVFSNLMREPAPVQPVAVTPAGKVAERLAWDGEEVSNPLRIAETVAMFSLPQADARTWSERSLAPVRQAELAPAKPVAAKAGVPRIAEIEDKQRKMALPPNRPVVVAEAPVAPTIVAKPETRPVKEPIKVLGWNVPGSDLLPSGKDAIDTVAYVGGTVLAIGQKAVSLPGKIGSLGSTASETVGWR